LPGEGLKRAYAWKLTTDQPHISVSTTSNSQWHSDPRLPEHPIALRRKLCHGLLGVQATAAQAKQRSREVAQCLAEIRVAKRRQQSAKVMSSVAEVVGGQPIERVQPLLAPSAATPLATRVFGRRVARAAAAPAAPPPPAPEREEVEEDDEVHDCSSCSPRPPRLSSQHPAAVPPPGLPPHMMLSGNSVLDSSVAQARREVRTSLLAACSCSEGERRAVVKQLLVRWHPDRNLDRVELATVIFQFIQQEKQSLLGL